MASMDELEARVEALESQVRGIREDAAAARVLAGGADRDVSAFSARLDVHKALLDALRETQIEHGQRIGEMDGRLTGRIDGLEQEMRSGFGMVAVGQAEILALLTRLDRPDQG